MHSLGPDLDLITLWEKETWRILLEGLDAPPIPAKVRLFQGATSFLALFTLPLRADAHTLLIQIGPAELEHMGV